ncbi:MAG: dephospho-CoA kinase, partial [Alphaproteobacteria bacterium]|nr:dephospho-CoA kinase [Alphaproteobacteria bacterium]
MIVIGLTGSIGMGKSTAARLLREMGVPVHCADEVVHDLLAPGGKAVRTVARLFPESLNAQRHAIDRTILGRIVFGDPAARERLEGV